MLPITCASAPEVTRGDLVSRLIAALNGELAAAGASRPLNSARVRTLLYQRAELLHELTATDPSRALAHTLPRELATDLRAVAPTSGLGFQGHWEGTLTAVIEDDFVGQRNRYHWYLLSPEGIFEVFFAGDGPKASGSKVAIDGISSRARIAAANTVELAAAVSPQCATTGPQRTAVVMLTTPSSPAFPAGYTSTSVERAFFAPSSGDVNTDSLNAYLREASYGRTWATGEVFGPFALAQDYTGGQIPELTDTALRAASSTVDFSLFTRIFFLLSPQPVGWGMSQIGCHTWSYQGAEITASLAWIALANYDGEETGVIIHEMGHSLGLGHANTIDYGEVPLGDLDVVGTTLEYGDPFSMMGQSGSRCLGQRIHGQVPAPHKLSLGWLQPGEYREVLSGGTFTLAPLEASSGLRALRILRDGASASWLWVEFRQPIGVFDTSLSTWECFGKTLNVFDGALIHYEHRRLDPLYTYLLDFTPNSKMDNRLDDFLDAALLPGRIWSDPYSSLTLAINSAGPKGLSVTVRYEQPPLVTVSAASFATGTPLAPQSIASGFGEGLRTTTEVATTLPLPTTLASTTVTVRDSAGVGRTAPLFFVSPGQINYLIPEGTKMGQATVAVTGGTQGIASGTLQIETVAPGLFTANADGQGVAAAVAVRYGADNSQTWDYVFQCGSAAGSCLPKPISLGQPTDRVYLQLYGTGIRGRSSLSSVSARVGPESAEVQYAGPQGGFVGLDQVNVLLPRSLVGWGEVNVVLTVDGKTANTVKVNVK